MQKDSINQYVMKLVSMSIVPLALTAASAEARGVGVGHQFQMSTSHAGRAMNPPQMKSLIIDTEVDDCTVLNCGAVLFSGVIQRNSSGDSIPFTADLYADANECLRVGLTYQRPQPADLKIVLVSPSGSIWKNDSSADSRPVVTARTDIKGHYTLHVNTPAQRRSANEFRSKYWLSLWTLYRWNRG
jgi:hypothetical protein